MPSRYQKARRPAFRDLAAVSDLERAELARRYWQTDEARKDIEGASRLRSADFIAVIGTWPLDSDCPRCGAGQVWRSRKDRDERNARCPSCRHQRGAACRCAGCQAAAEVQQRHEWAEAETVRLRLVAEWRDTYGSAEYADRMVKQLTASQQAFLQAVVELWGRTIYWEAVADRAGVQRHLCDRYLSRLKVFKLLFHDGLYIHLHPALEEGAVTVL